MSPTCEHLLAAVPVLPEADRLEMVEVILASLQSTDQPPFDESWRAIIQRRGGELRSGKVVPIPWEEVKRQARKKAC